MQNIVADALCLRAVDYKDDDKILTLYTAGSGKITVSARGVKKPKAKLKFAASPLCFGAYELIEKGGRYTLSGCRLYDGFLDLTSDIETYYCACAALELADKITLEGDCDASLLTLTVSFLMRLREYATARAALLFGHFCDIVAAAGYEMRALTLRDVHNYLKNTLDINIISLGEFLKLV